MAYNKEKFVEALLFFAHNTKKEVYGVLKAMKLLYFSDLEHLRRCQRTITGDEYYRHMHGPVPLASYKLIEENSPKAAGKKMEFDFESAAKIVPIPVEKGEQYRIIPKRQPNRDVFSDSDLEVLQETAEVWRDATADQIKKGSYEETQKKLGIDLQKEPIGSVIPILKILSPEEQQFVKIIETEIADFEKSLTI
jgi:hypothetical protein